MIRANVAPHSTRGLPKEKVEPNRRFFAFLLFVFAGVQVSFFLTCFSLLVGGVQGDQFLSWVFLNLFLVGGEVWCGLLLLGRDMTIFPFPLWVGFLAAVLLAFFSWWPLSGYFSFGERVFTFRPVVALGAWGFGITLCAWLVLAPVLYTVWLLAWRGVQTRDRKSRRRRRRKDSSSRGAAEG